MGMQLSVPGGLDWSALLARTVPATMTTSRGQGRTWHGRVRCYVSKHAATCSSADPCLFDGNLGVFVSLQRPARNHFCCPPPRFPLARRRFFISCYAIAVSSLIHSLQPQLTAAMALAQLGTQVRPYRDYLTPALHRRFNRASKYTLLLCYAIACWMGEWANRMINTTKYKPRY